MVRKSARKNPVADLDPSLMRLGQRVRQARQAMGLTLREAAAASGLSLRFYSSLEKGRANIAYLRLLKVARALQVELAALIEDSLAGGGARAGRVALLGLRGAGKSTLGPLLARALNWKFIELDERIEETAGLDLAELFSLHGEPYVRRLEERCLRELIASAEHAVIATGGGIVHNEPAFACLREHTTTVWLRATPEDHMRRVQSQGDHRPMANRKDAMSELCAILAAREPAYRLADHTVLTSGRTQAAALAEIRKALKHRDG